MSQQLFTPEADEPSGGLGYPLVLTEPVRNPVKPIMGVLLGVLAFVILVPVVSQLVLRLTWLLRGRPPFEQYQADALAYELPEGLLASHLGLAMLIVISVLLARYLHARGWRWLVSVQPGVRWRYLLACLLVALVVLNAVLWLSFAFVEMPAFRAPQANWAVFLAIILVTSPIQAAAEELFFRGYVLQALGTAFQQAWVGIVGSALLFALFHGVQNPALFVNRFAFGLVVGFLVWRTGGLEAAIGAHVVNNVFAFGYGIFTGGVAATKATSAIGWDKAFFDVLGFALFALAAWWVGRRMRVATTTP
ncbi:CPBP family intramembrane metalloprotease [Tessaracoccus rhinocerotis]|uniref:CPBP family intramembrane metalloprotease n=1 Tax=Tessaracoccus rhinocerotis TaxID=1689449 RepID=A0A553JVY4_9ACTN|nr:type II CAAX endopeptidase family protein [Tessaracoccus rhinocerotis]TRY16615.1 CPBP family intramembrane metalloprotease [Tessaracoccus rhinocerotis]